MTPALAHTPVLETARLILRAPRLEDFEPFATFATTPRSRFVRPADYDRAKAWRGFGHMVGHWALRGFGLFVLEERATGAAIGTLGPWFPEGWPERELGWTIWTEAAEGKGFAREAGRAALAWVFGPLGWPTAVSYIHPDNSRSIALAERLGARLDPDAHFPGEGPCLVYRHSRPEAAA